MSQDVANTAMIDAANADGVLHQNDAYEHAAFKRGWDAAMAIEVPVVTKYVKDDEEVNRLKRSLVEFALAESAHVEEVKRLRDLLEDALIFQDRDGSKRQLDWSNDVEKALAEQKYIP